MKAAVKERPSTKPSVTHALPPLWTLYRVRWTFLTRLCASVPADPEIVKKWIEALEPLGWIPVRHCRRGKYPIDHEREIHRVLATFRGRGEWFTDCPTVRRFIARYAQPWPEEHHG